ncbi:MAG: hypothetical protein GY768_14480 [Planctomycetaceae bacterium]|nr:hypothetical protein [Planctomycetaceae bacterium]
MLVSTCTAEAYRNIVVGWQRYGLFVLAKLKRILFSSHVRVGGLGANHLLWCDADWEPISQHFEYCKGVEAGKQLLRVLKAIANGNPGHPQQRVLKSFTQKDRTAIQLIKNPAMLDCQEFQHRIRLFDGIWLQ